MTTNRMIGPTAETKISDPKIAERPVADSLSRRAWLGGAAMIAGFGASCLMATNAAAKTPQAVAKYQDQPKGQAMCGGCSQFQAPEACNLVDGKISANGWCQLYSPKAG